MDINQALRNALPQPIFLEKKQADLRFVRLLSFAEMEGSWDSPAWTALHLWQPLKAKLPHMEVAGVQLESKLLFQEYRISPRTKTEGPLAQTVLKEEKEISTEALRPFLEYIINAEFGLFHRMPDLLFDGGEFILSLFYQGTEMTICSSDPPPDEALQKLLLTCQRLRKSIRSP